MKVLFKNDYNEVSKAAAEIFIKQIHDKPDSVLCLATGSTPLGLYSELIAANKQGTVDFSDVTTFNLDEYVGLDPKHEQSYKYFMEDNLFNHINIKKDHYNVPSGIESDYDAYCKKYEDKIESAGGIDLLLIGVGENGHIAFNEPDKSLSAVTHVVDLTEDTIQVNSRFFASADEVPKKAVTMGMGSILKAKKIVLIITGDKKAHVLERLMNDKSISTEFPVSFVLTHRDVTIIADAAACKNMHK